MPLSAPQLEGWSTLPEAAKILGVSSQAVHNMAEAGTFTSLRGVGSKPLYIVYTEEVEAIRDRRRDAEADRQEKLVEKDRTRSMRKAAGKPQLHFMVE